MRVLDRHLAKQIALPALAALGLLFQLLVALQLLRRVDVLLGGSVGLRDVLELLADLVPHYLVMSLPVSVLLGVLIGFGQLAEDRELDALASAGVSPWRLAIAPAALAAVGSLAVLGLALGPESWGLVRVRQKFDELLKQGVERGVKPGVFYDQVGGLTVFSEEVDPDTGHWRHVMIDDERDPNAPLLLLAQTGSVRPNGPEESLILDLGRGQGHREQSTGDDYTALEFAESSLAISVQDSLLRKNTLRSYDDERSLAELWRASRVRDGTLETLQASLGFHRRLGLILSVLALVWLGVPLALRPAASGTRARGYLFAAVAVVGYFVFLRLGTSLGMQHTVPAWVSGQLANLCFAAMGALAWQRLGRRA